MSLIVNEKTQDALWEPPGYETVPWTHLLRLRQRFQETWDGGDATMREAYREWLKRRIPHPPKPQPVDIAWPKQSAAASGSRFRDDWQKYSGGLSKAEDSLRCVWMVEQSLVPPPEGFVLEYPTPEDPNEDDVEWEPPGYEHESWVKLSELRAQFLASTPDVTTPRRNYKDWLHAAHPNPPKEPLVVAHSVAIEDVSPDDRRSFEEDWQRHFIKFGDTNTNRQLWLRAHGYTAEKKKKRSHEKDADGKKHKKSRHEKKEEVQPDEPKPSGELVVANKLDEKPVVAKKKRAPAKKKCAPEEAPTEPEELLSEERAALHSVRFASSSMSAAELWPQTPPASSADYADFVAALPPFQPTKAGERFVLPELASVQPLEPAMALAAERMGDVKPYLAHIFEEPEFSVGADDAVVWTREPVVRFNAATESVFDGKKATKLPTDGFLRPPGSVAQDRVRGDLAKTVELSLRFRAAQFRSHTQPFFRKRPSCGAPGTKTRVSQVCARRPRPVGARDAARLAWLPRPPRLAAQRAPRANGGHRPAAQRRHRPRGLARDALQGEGLEAPRALQRRRQAAHRHDHQQHPRAGRHVPRQGADPVGQLPPHAPRPRPARRHRVQHGQPQVPRHPGRVHGGDRHQGPPVRAVALVRRHLGDGPLEPQELDACGELLVL